MTLNGYKVIGELKTDNSGFSKWGFAKRNGAVYFIKEFLQPVYPLDESSMSSEMFRQKREACAAYEADRVALYSAINRASRRNLLKVEEFFRCGHKYYIATKKIESAFATAADFQKCSMAERCYFCRSLIFAVMCLHDSHIAHLDLKPANVLIYKTNSDHFVARVIDFDNSCLENSGCQNAEEFGGDLTYLAPESFLKISGEDAQVGIAADLFSLGLVLHEFLCGELPEFDRAQYDYPFEAALDGEGMSIHPSIPEAYKNVITRMLTADPESRITAKEAIDALTDAGTSVMSASTPESLPPKEEPSPSPAPEANRNPTSFFFQAGAL